jgi:hypothetical protein
MFTLTFREGVHIFFICYLKNYMTLFWDFWSKLFGNILKIFLISGSKFFKLIFLESSAENIENVYLIFNQPNYFCHFASYRRDPGGELYQKWLKLDTYVH